MNSLSFAQNSLFNVTIKWPKELAAEDFEVFINNGIETKGIMPTLHKNELKISGDFISKYVIISIAISQNSYNFPEYSQFYISEKPAIITFNSKLDSIQNFGSNIKTINAYNVSEISNKYDSFMEALELEKEEYLENHEMDSLYFSINRKLILKKLEFIKQNKENYFVFKKFQSEIAPLQFPFQDTLIDSFKDFYSNTFPEDILNSIEGLKVMKLLNSKWVSNHDNIKAPSFNTTDILGNNISLKNLNGKYILINFWATWCGPCMAEIPAIKNISDNYSNNKLKIISVSFDKDYNLFSDAIKKNKMDWINVFRDEEFASNYGGTNALPMLFLINTEGTIIYNRSAGKETDFKNLKVLNEVLEKEFSK